MARGDFLKNLWTALEPTLIELVKSTLSNLGTIGGAVPPGASSAPRHTDAEIEAAVQKAFHNMAKQ